jgi:hypothetical protein
MEFPSVRCEILNYVKSLRETDLEKLGRLKIFSWLSPSEVKALGSFAQDAKLPTK